MCRYSTYPSYTLKSFHAKTIKSYQEQNDQNPHCFKHKLILRAARSNRSAVDKAGRKFLLSLIFQNSGTYTKHCTHMSYRQVFSNPESWHYDHFICLKSPSQTTDTVPCTAYGLGTYLGVDRTTILKHSNSNSAFKDLKQKVQKKNSLQQMGSSRGI